MGKDLAGVAIDAQHPDRLPVFLDVKSVVTVRFAGVGVFVGSQVREINRQVFLRQFNRLVRAQRHVGAGFSGKAYTPIQVKHSADQPIPR